MTPSDLIGRVASLYLEQELKDDRGRTDGTARFILDCLTADQTGAIARTVLADAALESQVEIKLPTSFMAGHALPEEVLTDKRATYFRNSVHEKPVLLVANTGDDEQQSLREFVPIGTPQLLDRPELWVRAAATDLPLSKEHLKWWEKALAGLSQLNVLSLDRMAAYVLRTRFAVHEDGEPILVALAVALPEIRVPKDTSYFSGLADRARGHASQWKRLYENAIKKRAVFLLKQNTSQIVLTEDDLLTSFERVKESIPQVHHPIVDAFIHSGPGWNPQAAALAESEWEDVNPLFDGLRRREFNLGQVTIDFYEEREPGLITAAELEYLKRLIARKTTEPNEEDSAFYEAHRNDLKDDRKLKSAWDRFVFGRPHETEDFLSGIAFCLESLFGEEWVGSRRLGIRCDSASKKDLKELNVDAGMYFATRYRGLTSLLGNKVEWQVGQLFKFPALVEGWRNSGTPLNGSLSRSALQLKFMLDLEIALPTGSVESHFRQMVWKFNANAVLTEFVDDWTRLKYHPMVRCIASRDPVSSKGRFQTVDLSNVKTFVPVHGKDRGSFVPVYKKTNDIAEVWHNNLSVARKEGYVSSAIADVLLSKFDQFQSEYSSAVQGFLDTGLTNGALLSQLRCYSELLDEICLQARGDKNRELLLKPLLQVGIAMIDGGKATAIALPWQPLRMAAMSRKASLIGNLIKHLLTVERVHFGDARLFFKSWKEELAHPFYPEVVLGWVESKPELLSLSDVVGDYSLHESPVVAADALDETGDDPTEGANQVLALVQRYLNLHPHEQANLSIVLYNCDSARLPQAVVEKLGTMYEDETDIRCQVVLRHRDAKRLRGLYEEIIESSDNDPDSFNASESARDFMARLRISIMADQAPVPDPTEGCPADIVFSQDVIARRAQVEWFQVDGRPTEWEKLVPARWSRRRPAAKDDLKSVVYLCCPVQSLETWSFLTAVGTFFRNDWDGNRARRWLPARQLDFRDSATSLIFQETHNLGNWVVNYDELLDRRQLLNQNVRIIRFKQSATQGRNLIISSKASLSLLRSMVLRRLRDLNLDLNDGDYQGLADRLISDANDISGDIVLRAARRGKNASELIGIVLSRFLIRHELGAVGYQGWYFLDDYADWLGQKEEQIADILALHPEKTSDGRDRLSVIISEAKYIDAGNLAAKRKESQKQLRDSMKRIGEALFGNPERLDRELWLARLSDMVLDGIQFPASANVELSILRRSIRERECEIHLRGYSHVFVSGPADSAECSDFSAVAQTEDCYQEVYSRRLVRELLLAFAKGDDPMRIRTSITDQPVWEQKRYQFPAMVIDVETVNRNSKPSSEESKEVKVAKVSEQERESSGPASPIDHEQTTNPDLTSSLSPYPKIQSLFEQLHEDVKQTEDDVAWLKETENRTRFALQQFQLQAKLSSSTLTPNSGLFKFVGSANLTVDQVLKRRSEFLTTHGLNIIAVRPEPGVVAISIERPHRRFVQLEEAWRIWRPSLNENNQDLPLGIREDDGNLLFLSPGTKHAPHTLVAGSTGSGKSILIQNLILAICATNRPQQARIIVIDPKQGVDYLQLDRLPHLSEALVDDPERAVTILQDLVREMDDRYRKFKVARANNLAAFNQKVAKEQRLPVVWLIHDEFAEWMLIDQYREHVTSTVSRLGVKARAAGIYLIFAAQRPDANVMPMQLRANLGNRLVLRVDSEGTSEIALGEKGAERLLGRGHLLAKLEGESLLHYVQVPFTKPELIDRVISMICEDAQTILS